jgi:hypothetical protein
MGMEAYPSEQWASGAGAMGSIAGAPELGRAISMANLRTVQEKGGI